MFHGYQDLNKQGGFNVPNEVEACIYSYLVGEKLGIFSNSLNQIQSSNNKYDKARRSLLFDNQREMNSADFNTNFGNLVSGFKSNAAVNYGNRYKDAPLQRNGNRNLVKQFYNIKK